MVKGKQQRKIIPVMCSNTDLGRWWRPHFMSVNLPYGLGGNYMHFRIDRRQIRGQYVVFLRQFFAIRYDSGANLISDHPSSYSPHDTTREVVLSPTIAPRVLQSVSNSYT